eukprot:scaffold3414_cov208-Skeletonema_marinoi.AAC.1
MATMDFLRSSKVCQLFISNYGENCGGSGAFGNLLQTLPFIGNCHIGKGFGCGCGRCGQGKAKLIRHARNGNRNSAFLLKVSLFPLIW